MSVYKPAKGRYWHFDFQQKGRRYYGSTGATTRSKAERVEAAKRVAAASGELDRPAQDIPLLGEAATTWVDRKATAKTFNQLERRASVAATLIGSQKPVNTVTFSHIEEAIKKRRGQLVRGRPPANATVNRDIIATMRPTIKLARKLLNDGSGPPVAFPEIDWSELTLPEPKPKPRGLHVGEPERLAAVLEEHMRDFARFQDRYAARLGEMFFDPADLDIEGARVSFRERKGDDDHTVPIAAEDLGWLAARKGRAVAMGFKTIWWRPARPGEKAPKHGLAPLSYAAAGRAIAKGMTKIGVRSRGVRGSHGLRHTGVMRVLRDTGNLRAAQRLAGHSNITSTLVYAHVMEEDLRAILDKQSRPAPEPPAGDEAESARKPLRGNG